MKTMRIMLVSAIALTASFIAFSAFSPSGGKGIDIKNIDSTASASADFFQFANGNWIKSNPVPESESRWSSFDEVKISNQKELYKILENLVKGEMRSDSKLPDYVNTNKKQLAMFYASGMNVNASENEPRSVVKPLTSLIDNSEDFNSLGRVLSQLTLNGIFPLFTVSVGPDMNNSSVNTLYIGQGGLSMPDRDYYLSGDDSKVAIRNEYVDHVTRLLTAFGEDEGAARPFANAILEIEKELADASLPKTALRDPYRTNNRFMLGQLNQTSPAFEWTAMVNNMGVVNTEEVIVNNPAFFERLSKIAPSYTLDEWKMFLKWKVYRHLAPYVSMETKKEHFYFNESILKGVKEMQEPWKEVLDVVNANMGDALGQVFCESFYDTQSEARMTALIGNVKAAFRDRLAGLSWMSKQTREYAVMKLDSMTWKIGKPAKWKDYSSVNISSSYSQNILNLANFEMNRKLSQVGKPVDKSEWRISAATVNAYYSSTANEIVFPAGILQPPFFDKNADDAVIYGAIGAVIGHEIIHGFDDQGRKFDYKGNLKNWWTADDSASFSKIADRIVQQYSAYTVNGDLKVNGRLTLGENIADIGGLAIAFQAFKYAQKSKPAPAMIDGYTPDQRFFLSFAQVWRINIRPEEAARRILTDPHSPGKYRCNGTVCNMEPFYQAFNVKEGNAMYKNAGDRIVIW